MITLNGIKVTPTIFPDNTSQVWKLPKEAFILDAPNQIVWEFENEAELIHLVQLVDLVVQVCKCEPNLHMPYLPYGRQDKGVSNSSTFARHSFLNIISTLDINNPITTLDVHSKDYNQYLIKDIFPSKEIEFAVKECRPSLICFPDKGAETRYKSHLGIFPSFSMSKNRDQDTGYIRGLFLNDLVDIKNEDILIIDDICDGGGTFIMAAEKLLTLGARSISLYTTHGIYSKGINVLFEAGISRIFNRKGEVKK